MAWRGLRSGLLALAIVIAAPSGLRAQTDEQQTVLAKVISKVLSSPEGQVRIGAIEGPLSSDAVIRDLELSDPAGPWLRIDRARLVWRRTALLMRRLEVERLEIDRIDLLRKPVPSVKPAGQDGEPLLPDLPLKVVVSTFSVGQLVLPPAIAGTPARLGMSGSLSLGPPSEGLQLAFAARRQDRDGESDVMLSYRPEGGVLDLRLTHKESPGGLVAHLLDIDGRPAVDLALQGAGPLDAWQAQLTFAAGNVAHAAGNVTIARQSAGRRLQLDVAGQFERLLPPAAATVFAGKTRLEGRVDLADAGDIALSGLKLASDQAELTVSGTMDRARVIAVEAKARALPIATGGPGRMAALKALTLDARATGPLDAPHLDGRLAVEIARLDAFADEIGMPVAGTARLTADITGTPSDNTFDASFQMTGSALRFGNPRLAALLGSEAALSGKAARNGTRLALTSVALKARRIDSVVDGDADIAADGAARGQVRLTGTLDGRRMAGQTRFATSADGGLNLSGFDLKAADAMVSGTLNVAAAGAVTGAVTAEIPTLGAFSGALGTPLRGALSAQASFSTPQGAQQASLKAKGRNLAGFGASATTVDVEAQLHGHPSRPSGTFRAGLAAIQHPDLQRAGVPKIDLNATGTLAGDHVTLNSTLRGGAALALKVTGEAPLAAAGKLALAVTGTVDAALANGTLTGPGQRITGRVAVDGAVRGTIARPLIDGAATLRGGSFVDLLNGVRLADIAGRIAGAGTALRIDQMTAATPGGGQIAITGSIDADGARGFPAQLRVTGRDAQLIDNDVVDLVAGLDLSITGPLARAPVVSGQVNVVSFDITIPDRLPADAAPFAKAKHLSPPEQTRERLRLAERANARKAARKASPAGAARLAVRIVAPSHIFVRGRGIDAELGGEVTLSGSLLAPLASGAFDLRRGQINMLTQRLEFSRGRLTFQGDSMPDLDFVAATSAGGITAKVSVTGRADSPAFALTSEPQLPPDEVLSRLMFERAVGSLSPLQAVQLAQAVARLTGRGGPDFLEKTRQALGVDTLDVSADKSGPTVGASRYITRDIRLGVKAGATPEQSGVTANVDMGRRIRLQGETGPSGKTSIGIGAEIEY